MGITVEQMQREVVQYAMEETRNRGLEEAARLVECRSADCRGQTRYAAECDARAIRNLKRDPSAKMTDWWKKDPICDFAPMGA